MQIIQAAAYVILITFVIALLIVGKTFFVPLFLAIVIWYLINSINELLKKSTIIDKYIPNGITLFLSAISIIGILFLFGNLIAQSIDMMRTQTPVYQVNIEQQLQRMLALIGLENQYSLSSLTTELNLNDYIRSLINSITTTAQRFFLVMLYVLFLLIEQDTFSEKLAVLSWTKERRENFLDILSQINQSSRTYIAVKSIASFMTGLLSFFVLYFIGVDFPVFWAFLIFLLNYIPTIGSAIATAFPAIVALVQFDTLSPFFGVLIGIIGVQTLIGSFLEPRYLGSSLNISPFVIILSLVLWGIIWGVVGMLLCVPLTVIIIIILAQFPDTRNIAILLSKKGKIAKII